ncbi:uncharacterized secreted ARB_08043-like [Lecanosticta acicola]|uniref:Uncharacterized secreted ARB_08043-like n=1 Tax=Lecanosticta acicola TaxID=111012 RepID=A0AAI9EB24_9PEZI|nr:uncharacterized secreted ARB_08043-like [Lecanosticta acicola]
MLSSALWLLCLAAAGSNAQDTSSSATSSGSTSSSTSPTSTSSTQSQPSLSFTLSGWSTLTGSEIATSAFTGTQYTYLSYTTQTPVTLVRTTSENGTLATITTTSMPSNSQITVAMTSASVTAIVGSAANSTTNQTATATTSSARPSNTLPCNGFPEFCTRKYSNITMVAAHNAAFVIKNNAASNQQLPIRDQLNDGIRMLTGEVHYVNNTLYNCHTNCNILNAGTWQTELETLKSWLDDHPYDVVTVLIVNSDFTAVENFVAPITNSGLLSYAYTPSYIPQYRDQWPTLGEMILKNQRVVFMMDYKANQNSVPYILDEFSQVWETPFSPTDQAFPCTQQRPPNLDQTKARDDFMYLANHNLNTAIDLSSLGISGASQILIPNTAELNITNGEQNEYGRLGAMSINCTNTWNRPPNFLLVDYYNIGSPTQGSVFDVAATANGVTYTQQCCGLKQSAAPVVRTSFGGLFIAVLSTVVIAW